MKSQINKYKQSYGHAYSYSDTISLRRSIEKQYPDLELHVVEENRSNNKWASFCVCEYKPEKGKTKVKKSNRKVKNKSTHNKRKVKSYTDTK